MANATVPISAITAAPYVSAGNAIVNAWRMFSSESVAASTSVDSILSTATGGQTGLMLSQGSFFGLWVQCTSTGTATYTMQWLQSWSDTSTSLYVQPDLANIVPGSTSGSTAFTDNASHIVVLAPVPMPLGVLRITNTQTTAALSANAVLFEVR